MSYDPSQWKSYTATRDGQSWQTGNSSYSDQDSHSSDSSYFHSGLSNHGMPTQLSDETLNSIHIDENLIATLRSQGLAGSFPGSNEEASPSQECLEHHELGAEVESKQPVPDCMEIELKRTEMLEMTDRLTSMIRELSSSQQKKIDKAVIAQLTVSLMDGTVFEIVKGLEDIQQLKERNLLNRRVKLLGDQKIEKANATKKYERNLKNAGARTHQKALVTRQYEVEKDKMERKLRHELLRLDQKLVLELDQQVSDQQATLQRAGVPLFFVTNKPEDVKLQMTVLEIITRVAD